MNCMAAHTMSVGGNIDFNLHQTLACIDFAERKGTRFVLFPELNLSGYTLKRAAISAANERKEDLFKTLTQVSLHKKIAFAVGFPERANGKIFVSHFIFDKGKLLGIHRKTHLSAKEKGLFTQGNAIEVFTVGTLKIGIQLCYESHFPEISFAQEQQGANLLAVAFASPGTSSQEKSARFVRFLSARAYDNACYLMACNLSGQTDSGMPIHGLSMAFSPKGELLQSSTDKETGYCCFNVDEEQIKKLRRSKMSYFNQHKRKELFTAFYEASKSENGSKK
ncbi:MAG: hypothetical protein CSB01_00830 [Bacteroidia bacterium]|nr:MAG: hypothetical protein CSB01_00830 [Bacteroidia bacterium]